MNTFKKIATIISLIFFPCVCYCQGSTTQEGLEFQVKSSPDKSGAFIGLNPNPKGHISFLSGTNPWDVTFAFGNRTNNGYVQSLFITNTNKVVIGYTVKNFSTLGSAKYKLFVGGGIRTESVHIDLAQKWPDYVFNKDYKLKSLKDVENYINSHHHLQGIPDVVEVNKDGIDVATMEASLLEKIEELTLYLISMQKENELLKSRLDSIEKLIK